MITAEIDQNTPSLFVVDVQNNHLEDETNLIPFGNADETYFTSVV